MNKTRGRPRQPIAERFWSHVGPHDDPNACWLWLGCSTPSRSGARYGRFNNRIVHRVAYELLVGPIPKGLTIDHVKSRGCTDTLCVNPAHLEPVTVLENILRGNGWAGLNARKTHCKRGHLFDDKNTIPKNKGRQCLACSEYNQRKNV